jgi:hypothetical protein
LSEEEQNQQVVFEVACNAKNHSLVVDVVVVSDERFVLPEPDLCVGLLDVDNQRVRVSETEYCELFEATNLFTVWIFANNDRPDLVITVIIISRDPAETRFLVVPS